MKSTQDTVLIDFTDSADPEFAKALQEAIQDPERRKELIAFLETIGLLPSAHQWPA